MRPHSGARWRSPSTFFPSITGGLRAVTVLTKPFRAVVASLGWKMRFTPQGMRRTFNDLARAAAVPDLVTRAISGHVTEQMQHHYSTARREEMRGAVGSVFAALTETPSSSSSPADSEGT